MLYLLHIHLVSLLRLCVDFDDMSILGKIVCCLTTPLMFDCMLLVYAGHTCISFISLLVLVDSVSLYCVFDKRLVTPCMPFDQAND